MHKAYNNLKPQVQCLNFLSCQWKFYGKRDWKMYVAAMIVADESAPDSQPDSYSD